MSALLLLGASPLVHAAEPLASTPPTTNISNGSQVGVCGFPAVMRLQVGGNSFCTGTLVHPQVIAYAAHCGRLSSARFGETSNGPGVTNIQKTMVNPSFTINNIDSPTGEPIDWAFAVLSEPVKGVPVIPFAYGEELKELIKSGAPVAMAGYGVQRSGGNPGPNMHWAPNRIGELSEGWIQAGLDRKNGCPGDSGGPLLARRADGSWRVIGITSTLWGDNNNASKDCGASSSFNHYSRVRPAMLKWLEANSGFDLTPCHEPDGTLKPTQDCARFFAGDPRSPSGSWNNQCADAKVLEEPYPPEQEPDTQAPEVSFDRPEKGDTCTVHERCKIRIDAEDDVELAKVELRIEGHKVESWDAPPFSYDWRPEDAGSFELVALAVDAAGNEETTTRKVKVKSNDEDSSDPSDDDTSKSGTPDPDTNDDDSSKSTDDDSSSDSDKTSNNSSSSSDKSSDSSDNSASQDPSDESPTPSGCALSQDRELPTLWAFGIISSLMMFRRRTRGSRGMRLGLSAPDGSRS